MNTPLEIEAAEAVMIAAYDASAAIEVEAPETTQTAEFAYTDFGAPGTIMSRSVNEEIGFETVIFKNNVVLNFKKTDFQEDVISIIVRLDGTTLTFPQELRSLAGFASTAINAGGLGAHSNDELRTILAGKAIGTNLGFGAGGFSISGATVPDDLPDQLNLMVARMIDPGYREEALTRYVKSIESSLHTRETTAGGVAGRYISQILRDGDPRFRSPEKEEYLTADLDDPERLVNEIARTFGALPKRNREFIDPDLSLRQLKFPAPTPKPIELYHSGDETTARLNVYWPRPPYNSFEDWPQSVRLGLINNMLRLRLIEVLREEEGATYSPRLTGYATDLYPDYAYTGVSVDVSPEDIDRLYSVIDKVTGDLRGGDFNADLLDRARKPILENIGWALSGGPFQSQIILRFMKSAMHCTDL